jgi:hypothetical protein
MLKCELSSRSLPLAGGLEHAAGCGRSLWPEVEGEALRCSSPEKLPQRTVATLTLTEFTCVPLLDGSSVFT